MSEKSDDELVGDVDLDFDLHEITGSRSQDVKSDGAKEQLPAKEHQSATIDGDKDRTSKVNPAVSVKRPVKRKAPANPSVGNDLLQAFAIGASLGSAKTASQVGIKKKKPEPVLSKKTVSGHRPSVEKETISKENVKNGSEIKTTEKDHKDSNVIKGELEKKEIKPDNGLKEVATSKNEVKKEERKQEVKMELDGDVKQKTAHTVSTNQVKKDVVQEIKKKLDSNVERKTADTVSRNTNKVKKEVVKQEINDELDLEIQQQIADALSRDSTNFKEEHEETKKQKTTMKGEHEENPKYNSPSTDRSNKSSTHKKIEEISSGSLKRKIQETKETTSLKETPKEKSPLTDRSSKTPNSKKIEESQTVKYTKETTPSINLKKNDSNVSKVSSKNETMKDTENAGYKFTEEDYKNIDLFLADQMFDRIRQKAISSKQAVRYTVKVSPLEMSDLAQPSFQQIIQLHPSTTLFFKHQAVKFRKKKGFAESTFYTMTELKEFVYQLTQLKVYEKKIDILITAQRPMQKPDTLSFVLHLNRNDKLLKLIDSGEDPMINKPVPVGINTPKIQFTCVPSTSNGAFMHSMFPFTNNVLITRSKVGKETNPVYHGPLSVFYVNDKWLEAVTECCTDFTANDYPLTLVGNSISGNTKTGSESKTEKTSVGFAASDIISGADYDDDDPVSNMTRDVCADMLESISKLKELESDNPNMKRILEMQAQLNELHKSLIKPGKTKCEVKEVDEGNDGENLNCKLTPGEKKQKETKSLEEMLEEADRAERQREEQAKEQREAELQKKRELELKRKSQWARNVLSDYKQQNVKGEMSEGAERMLKQREQRIKDREEEDKRRVVREEKERLRRLQEKEEEERRDAERKRLIQKIEEARLKDSQKADKLSSSQLMWNTPGHDASTNRHGSESASGKRDRETDQRLKRENVRSREESGVSSSAMIDDGMDERLANFEWELAQQGKIERRNAASPTDRADHDYIPEDESEDFTVVMENDYQELWAQNQLHTLPVNYRVRLSSLVNRFCPVQSCPAKTCFRDEMSYQEHWSIFHEPHTTMRFCQKCSAYFMNYEELEKHMMKHHHLTSLEAKLLARSSRVKIVPNPSFRDPLPFLPPLSSS